MGDVLRRAVEAMAGVHSGIALAMERRRSVPRYTVVRWIEKLRAAADELERGLK